MKTLLLLVVFFSLASLSTNAATKADYIDLVEIAVKAYTPERIESYIADVEKNGITEHGFARLTANLAVAVANGRLPERKSQLEHLMDLCAREQPIAHNRNGKKAGRRFDVGAEFAIRELVLALVELERAKIFPAEKTAKWRAAYRAMQADDVYSVKPKLGDPVARNWVIFGIASEQARIASGMGGDPAWVEKYAADQLRFFDEKGMFRDPGCPMVYDLVPRLQYAAALDCGYNGPSSKNVEAALLQSAEATLAMQSVTGEIPYGGRSQQFLHTDTLYAALCEWYAKYFAARGDLARAQRFRSAADRAVQEVRRWTNEKPIRHIKNHYPTETGYGCEFYAYFNKYMVTMGSWAALAARFVNETIPCESDYREPDSVLVTSRDFHRVILNARGYTLQFDLKGQSGYDASGLGRLQRRGTPSALALSVPFPIDAHYKLDVTNETPLAIGPQSKTFSLIKATNNSVVLSANTNLLWESRVDDSGVTMMVTDNKDISFALPALSFDGETTVAINYGNNWLDIEYKGWVCHYETDGRIIPTDKIYGNRNGHYRLFEARGQNQLVVKARIYEK